MTQKHKIMVWLTLGLPFLLLPQAATAQYQINGGTALDANPLLGSGGVNGPATSYWGYQSYVTTPNFQLTGQGLISSYSGYTPRLGPSVMQVLTGRYDNSAPPVVSTSVNLNSGAFGGASITSVGPAMTVPNQPGGALNVQQQLAPTLGSVLGPSPYASLLQQNPTGSQLATPGDLNKFFGPPQVPDMMGMQNPMSPMGPPGPSSPGGVPGQLSSLSPMLNLPPGVAAPRGIKSAVVSELAAQFSRGRTTSELLPASDDNTNSSADNNSNADSSLAGSYLNSKIQAAGVNSLFGPARPKSSWNPYDQNPADNSAGGSVFDIGGTGSAGFNARTVNPLLYADQSLLPSASNRPPPVPIGQNPPIAGGSGTSWLDTSPLTAGKTRTDPWQNAVDATRTGLPARPGQARLTARGGGGGGPADTTGATAEGSRANPWTSPLQPLANLNSSGSGAEPRKTRSTTGVENNPSLALKDDIASNKNKADQYLRQAKQAVASGQFYEAIGAFNLASVVLKLTPEDEMEYLEALVAVGSFEQANEKLEKIVEKTGSVPDLTLEHIKPANRMTMVRFLQAEDTTAARLDRRFWMGVLTINQKERISIFRKLQVELLTKVVAATQPNATGVFSSRTAKALLDYLSRQLEQR